jgi:hypothetical protein
MDVECVDRRVSPVGGYGVAMFERGWSGSVVRYESVVMTDSRREEAVTCLGLERRLDSTT